MLRAVEPALQQCKQLLAPETRPTIEGCLKSAPSLNTVQRQAATAVRAFAASEAQDPAVGGVASGAMPEAPAQPNEPPNQKPPGVNIEVPTQMANEEAMQNVAPQVPAIKGNSKRLPDAQRPGAEDLDVNDPAPRHQAAREALGAD